VPDFNDPRIRHLRVPRRFEYVDERICPVVYKSYYAAEVANRVSEAVNLFLVRADIGECGVGTIHRLPLPNDPDRERRTDCSYVSYARWPADRPGSYTANAWDIVPELVAEVASFDTPAENLMARVGEYLRAGVRLVWAVYPLTRQIHAYWAGANTIRVYTAADELDAGDILPGFRTLVAPLFPPVAPA